MTESKIWRNVDVKLDTDERISGELGDLLFNCGLEILRKRGDAVICNQTDVVEVGGDVYVAIGLSSKYVSELETVLSMIDAVDSFTVFEDAEFVLIQGDGVVIDEKDVEEIKRSARDITAEVVSDKI
jgi:hypothetical protein